jgi:polyisoprenoid-binding protein YceI
MKKTLFSLALTLVFGVSAIASPIDGEKKEIKTNESTVTWKGYKVAGDHSGTINLKSGHLMFDGKKLTGGEFTIDMSTLTNTDMEGGAKGKLEAHLKSEDFFGVENHPTASLVITKAVPFEKGSKSYTTTGDLTIKGITESVVFVITLYEGKAVATLKVDRTKFDVKYGSGIIGTAKDKLIYDEFDIVANLKL